MKEYITEAIVLNRDLYKENDLSVDLFTKDLGRLKARVVGGKKPLSKLSPNLDFLNLVTLRLVEKNQFTVADVVTKNFFKNLKSNKIILLKAIQGANLIRALLPLELPDKALWHEFSRMLRGQTLRIPTLLQILGYDPKETACVRCKKNPTRYFLINNQALICNACVTRVSKDQRDVVDLK